MHFDITKKKLRGVLLNSQKIDNLNYLLGWSRSNEWYPEKFFRAHYPALIIIKLDMDCTDKYYNLQPQQMISMWSVISMKDH